MVKSVTAVHVGGVNMKGKKSRLLHCGCCTCRDLREKELLKQHKKEMREFVSEQS